jgi:hypothetical protein
VASGEDSREKHPIRYSIACGFFFWGVCVGPARLPFVVAVALGAVVAFIAWTGWRRNGWLRRRNERRKAG